MFVSLASNSFTCLPMASLLLTSGISAPPAAPVEVKTTIVSDAPKRVRDVRYWHLADMAGLPQDVRFWEQSGHGWDFADRDVHQTDDRMDQVSSVQRTVGQTVVGED